MWLGNTTLKKDPLADLVKAGPTACFVSPKKTVDHPIKRMEFVLWMDNVAG